MLRCFLTGLAAAFALSTAYPALAATPDPCSLVTPDQLTAAGASGVSTRSLHGVFAAECFLQRGSSMAGVITLVTAETLQNGLKRFGHAHVASRMSLSCDAPCQKAYDDASPSELYNVAKARGKPCSQSPAGSACADYAGFLWLLKGDVLVQIKYDPLAVAYALAKDAVEHLP
jgi:hypothetical protein